MAPLRDIRRSPATATAPRHRRRRRFLGLLLLPLIAAAEPPESEADSVATAEPPVVVLDDEIVVTATGTEGRLADTASAVTVLGADDLAASAAITLDDTLRQVPGFTLFRRSGSRSANPTIQGASLRGAGGSGAGRALVLADGVPLADPFGGWVAWSRVPRVALARVEVLRGGASDLYGSAALAGVVQVVRRRPADGGVVAEVSAGGQGTRGASLWAAHGGERWAAGVAGELFETTGHVPVAPTARGAVDAPAGVAHDSLELTVERRATGAGPRLVFRAGRFAEERTNGTRLQENATTIEHGSLAADRGLAGGTLSAHAWAADHRFSQTFTAVAEDRASERLVRSQRVPSDELGARLGWNGPAGSRHTLVAGAETARRDGISRERVFLGAGELTTAAGGTQEVSALFVEDLVRLGPALSLAAGLRYDGWRNRPAGGGDGERPRSDDHLSPRLALRWQPRPDWGFTAGGFRSFRAPTLNELYRGFRVGDVVTEPNADLAAERATGVEAGAIWEPGAATGRGGRLRLRGSLFAMRLDDPITNLTLAVEPGLIRRQRRNLGRTRSRGAELEAEVLLGRRWHLGAAYLYTDAEVVRFPADPTLEGLRVPQVAEHQGSIALRGAFGGDGRGRAALQLRAVGEQADDDRNQLLLDSFVRLDGRLGWELGRGVEAWVAGENLLDEGIVVGRTPEVTLDAPRLLRLGLRWRPGG